MEPLKPRASLFETTPPQLPPPTTVTTVGHMFSIAAALWEASQLLWYGEAVDVRLLYLASPQSHLMLKVCIFSPLSFWSEYSIRLSISGALSVSWWLLDFLNKNKKYKNPFMVNVSMQMLCSLFVLHLNRLLHIYFFVFSSVCRSGFIFNLHKPGTAAQYMLIMWCVRVCINVYSCAITSWSCNLVWVADTY